MTWMQIEDVFTVDSRGPVITGRVQGGPIRPGDKLWLMSGSDPVAAITVVHVGQACGDDPRIAPSGQQTFRILPARRRPDIYPNGFLAARNGRSTRAVSNVADHLLAHRGVDIYFHMYFDA